ncbi:CCR4-NOT transcription complex, subunit 3 [Phytophthora ramorum]
MAGIESTCDGGREGSERGDASRSSRRVQGLPPEEQATLDEVVRNARKANAAKRKAAQEAKESTAQEEDTSGSAVQEARQANQDGDVEVLSDGEEGSEWSGSESGSDDENDSSSQESDEASEGDVVKVEPPAEDRVSDSLQPEEEVEILDDIKTPERAQTIKDERPLSTVQEDAVLEDVEMSLPVRSDVPLQMELPDVVSMQPPSTAMQKDYHPEAQEVETGTADVQMTEAQAKAYVADQVRRWERDVSEKNVPPDVKYDWPQVRLDSESFMVASLTTSDYLRRRMSMPTQADAWIAEMQLRRRTFGMARDLTAALIPPGMFTPRDCVAVLQTILFEAGFEFVNLVPGWFRTRVYKVHPDLVRRVVGEMLQLLVVELIEWRQVVNQAQEFLKVLSQAAPRDADRLRLEVAAHFPPGVVVATDHEINLLGSEYVWHLKAAGFRKVRSPRGVADEEAASKRVQRVAARPPPSSIPSPSSLQSVPSSVVQNLEVLSSRSSLSSAQNVSERIGSDSTPSMFETSGGQASRWLVLHPVHGLPEIVRLDLLDGVLAKVQDAYAVLSV